MGRKVLKVWDDFFKKDFKEGDIAHFFEGRVRILDLDYRNEFGTFILGEYVDVHEEMNSQTITAIGISPKPENPFEIVGTIHIPGYRNLLGGIGFFVKNRMKNETVGYSYSQTWELVFHQGAVNAKASRSRTGMFFSRLIDSIDGVPSLDSSFWKIPAYDEEGQPFAVFTEEALKEILKGLRYAVRNRVSKGKMRREPVNPDFSSLEEVAGKMRGAKRIVVLAGAGLSTNSGIPDYRSAAEGLWLKNPTMLQNLNQEAFEKNPSGFWDSFYELIEQSLTDIVPFTTEQAILATLEAIEPNQGHRFCAWLSKELGKNVTVITQNVDGLEHKAGCGKVIQVHGNIHECICPTCKGTYPLQDVLRKNYITTCSCGSVLRPNVVFFGDQVQGFEKAKRVIARADLVLVVGTGLEVFPFNQLPYCKGENTKIALLNGTLVDGEFDYVIKGDINQICHLLKKQLRD